MRPSTIAYLVLLTFLARNIVTKATTIEAINGLKRIIWGPIWNYDEICGIKLSPQSRRDVDTEVERYINGSMLENWTAQSTNLSSFQAGYHELIFNGIRAKGILLMFCSHLAWGYQDKRDFELGNKPFANEQECKTSLDQFYSVIYRINSSSVHQNHLTIDQSITPINELTMNSEGHDRGLQAKLAAKYQMQIDTFGRAPASLLHYSNIWPGDFDTCTRIPNTRYCFGAYKMVDWPESTNQQVSIRIGACLPRSCTSDIVKSDEYLRKLDYLMRYNLIDSMGLNNYSVYRMMDLHCPPAEGSVYRYPMKDLSSVILITLSVMWLALIIYSTLKNEKSSRMVAGFNVRTNWTLFRYRRYNDSRLRGLNGMKFFALFWLVMSHLFVIITTNARSLLEIRESLENSLLGNFLLQGHSAVPLFYTTSGLIASYRNLRNDKFKSFDFVLDRYTRLMPLYLVVYAFHKKFFHLTGNGPFWDHGVSIASDDNQCRQESWLVPILMLSNFIPPSSHCFVTGWHISNDFYCYATLPILFYIYRKSVGLGRLVCLLTYVASRGYHYYNWTTSDSYSESQFRMESALFGPKISLSRMVYDYVNPFGRIGCYFLGAFLADLLINAQKSLLSNDKESKNSPETKNPRVNKKVSGRILENSLVFLGSAAMIISLIVPASPRSVKKTMNFFPEGMSFPTIQMGVELGWAVIFYRMIVNNMKTNSSIPDGGKTPNHAEGEAQSKGHGGISFGKFIRSPIWDRFSPLVYGVTLIHTAVIRYTTNIQREPIEYSWTNLAAYTCSCFFFSMLAALFIHLLVELPLRSLIDLMLEKPKPESKNDKEPNRTLRMLRDKK